MKTTLDSWSELYAAWITPNINTSVFRGLTGSFRAIVRSDKSDKLEKIAAFNSSQHSSHPIHSCIIDRRRFYIHALDLPLRDPAYFFHLQDFAARENIQLRVDRRQNDTSTNDCRRRKLLPVIFLTLGVANSLANANELKQTHTLNIISGKHNQSYSDASISTSAIGKQSLENIEPDIDDLPKIYDIALSAILEKILLNHYQPEKNDPDSIKDDIVKLAKYYSTYPEAIKLINALSLADWKLKYAPHTFKTTVSGTRLTVEDIDIYFDPRSGAKLKFYDKCETKKPFCVASPADALLHEFLHAHTIINDTNRFIADGGLGGKIYPEAHERKTILKENALYSAMSERDNKPRPLRSEHSGRHVLVSCVTCLK
jgi:hypothetical protein